MDTKQLHDFMVTQVHEMEKYKWCLGEQLHHDPLNDRSIEEIYCDWIKVHAVEFRLKWEREHKICE